MRVLSSVLTYGAAGSLLGAAFLYPGKEEALVLGWTGCLLLVFLLERSLSIVRGMFVAGYAVILIAHYWLPFTIQNFGGFNSIVSPLLYAVFCALAALQFVLTGLLYRRLAQTGLSRFALAFPLAWVAVEAIFPQLFPWTPVHTQLIWGSYVGALEYTGTLTLNFLFLWLVSTTVVLGSTLLEAGRFPFQLTFQFVALVALPVVLANHGNAMTRDALALAPELRVGLIQGNLEAHKKRDVTELEANVSTYQRLSTEAVKRGAEIVLWPESIMTSWMNELLPSVAETDFDPWPKRTVPMLYGGLTYRMKTDAEFDLVKPLLRRNISSDLAESLRWAKFNSALVVDRSGKVLGKYSKQVLMPFGEYLPFESTIPELRLLSPYTGAFDFGTVKDPISISLSGGRVVEIMTLICYEDLVPQVALEGVQRGATLLVNIANDAWYGNTIAPHQHNMLAAFRAIESRRYLLRATNTGLTSIIDPFGRTVSALPTFQEGALVEPVKLLRQKTLISGTFQYHGYLYPVLGLLALLLPSRGGFSDGTSSLRLRAVE